MPRITKAPEERKNELIDAAQELFNTKGFEQTKVSDIVKHVKVAQGLFYYYFKTKEEILDAIILKNIKLLTDTIVSINNDTSIDAQMKLEKIVSFFVSLALTNEKIVNYAHREKSSTHGIYGFKMMDIVVPLIKDIIEQGNTEGTYHTKYIQETAKVLLVVIDILGESVYQDIGNIELLKISIKAGEDIIGRILGVQRNDFHIDIQSLLR